MRSAITIIFIFSLSGFSYATYTEILNPYTNQFDFVAIDPNIPISTGTISAFTTSSINGTFIGLGRNRILNGDMRFDQNNEGASYTTSVGSFYALDQWRFESTGISTYTITRTGANLPNTFFNEAMKVVAIASGTIVAATSSNMEYAMEPAYQEDWGWGTGSAVSITLQFYVYCSSAGTYSISLLNGINSRSYVSTYTVTAANTWQKEIITFPGDTVGGTSVWPSSSTVGTEFGLKVVWDLGTGSNSTTSTLNQWQSANTWKASGSNSLQSSLGTIYFTGIQLEIGSKATAFEYLPYNMELAALQRYYWKTFLAGTRVAGGAGTDGTVGYISQIAGIAGADGVYVKFPVEMLTAPTITFYNPQVVNAKWRNVSAVADSGTASDAGVPHGTNGFFAYNPQVAGDGAGAYIAVHLTANARLGGS